jgi:hypothetical protein
MYNVQAQFPKQPVCRDRQAMALTRWAAYTLAQAIPVEKPAESFVEQRLMAARFLDDIDYWTGKTMQLTLADPSIQTNIRQHLSAFNDETTEASMDAQMDAAVSGWVADYAHGKITQQEIDDWYAENGFPPPEPIAA